MKGRFETRTGATLAVLLLWLPVAVFAQQHEPDLRWRTLHTPHFKIHFPEGYETLARQVARICEEVYEPVSRALNYRPHTTEVVIHTRTDFSNGFVTALPWRMELHLTEPQDNWMGSKDTWLRVLITHEFTHVVHLRKTRGFSKLTYPFFGQFNSFWQMLSPNWFIEGYPTHVETRYTRGGRGRNPYHFMQFAATIAGGRPWRLENTNYLSRKRQPLGMRYVAGYYLSQYIQNRFGDSTWANILDRYSAWPFLGFGHAVKKVTHQKPKALYRQMLDSLKNIATTVPGFRPPAARVLAQPQLPENQTSPRWLDDSTLVVYHTSFDVLPQVEKLYLSGRAERLHRRRLAQQENALTVRQNRIAWVTLEPNPRYGATDYADLELFDLRTGNLRRLTRNARVTSPDWSPDGRQIVAVQNDLPHTRLVRIDAASGRAALLLNVHGASLLNPRWSPDGRFIAFAFKDSTGRQDIAILDVQRREWRFAYPPDRYHDNHPAWSPDGRWLLYASDRSGTFNIWAVEVATGQRWLVTNDSLGAFSPAVSPDGRQLAFTRYTPVGFAVAVMPFDPQHFLAEARVPAADFEQAVSAAAIPQNEVHPQSWRVTPYRLFPGHLLPQAWFPFASQDENGTAVGLYMLRQDALYRHFWRALMLVSPVNGKPTWDVSYSYSRFWPVLDVRYANLPQKVSYQGFEGFWRKNILELTVRMPLTLEQNVYRTFVQPYVRYRQEDRRRSAGRIVPRLKRYRGVQIGLRAFRGSQTLRDVVPYKAAFLNVFSEWTVPMPGNEFSAQQFGMSFVGYWPTWLRHHQLQVLLVYHNRRGNFAYSGIGAAPLGGQDFAGRQQLRAKLAYIFPVAYAEWPVPLLPLYIDYLFAGAFYDWGTHWNHGLGRDRWFNNDQFAAGVQMGFRGSAFQNLWALAGVRFYYQSQIRQWTWQPFVQIDF
ncbi:MAG: hypothetical protein Q9P90_19455 [candidate division KSB1 bacterium]|nr:hypothetical protein [candidate division KSB1 bacterium]